MVECAYFDCDNTFEPNVQKRQKYCSYQCSVKANNARAMAEYHERKRIMGEPHRKCQTVGCPTILRKTNTDKYCDPCKETQARLKEENFRRMILG